MSKTSTTKKIITSPENMNERIDNESDYQHEPGDNVINNILNYSKALSIRKSKNFDNFEMVLN